jgi:hypothetical protein
MQVTTAVLADFVQVREGLLFVASGGITRLWRAAYPAPMHVMLAVVVELDWPDRRVVHALDLVILDEDGHRIADLRAQFQVNSEGEDPGERINTPLAIDLRAVEIPRAGRYEVRVGVDGDLSRTLAFRAGVPPGA